MRTYMNSQLVPTGYERKQTRRGMLIWEIINDGFFVMLPNPKQIYFPNIVYPLVFNSFYTI